MRAFATVVFVVALFGCEEAKKRQKAQPEEIGLTGVCDSDGWCWENPRPQGFPLNALWATADDDVWAVGLVGTILHWDGESWAYVASGTLQPLDGVWASGANDVWVVGRLGIVLHWDGESFVEVEGAPIGVFKSVWGKGSEVWIAADEVVHNFDGDTWGATNLSSSQLNAVFGTSATNVWVVGDREDADVAGFVARWNGEEWETLSSQDVAFNLSSVWGTGPDDMWVAGVSGAAHWDGNAFTLNSPELATRGIAGQDELWAVGDGMALLDNGEWSSGDALINDESFGGFSAITANGTWAVGDLGVMVRHTDNGWEAYSHAVSFENLLDVWSNGPDNTWAVGNAGIVLQWDGETWRVSLHDGFTTFYGVSGTADDDVWAVGQSGTVMHWNGEEWSALASGTTGHVRDVHAVTRNNAWFVGDAGAVLHWNGMDIDVIESGTTDEFAHVWASSTSDVWIARNADAALVHWDGENFADVLNSAGSWNDLWGSGPDDVWAVGYPQEIGHWTNGSFSISASEETLGSISGSGPNDAWAMGGHLHYWNGLTWTDIVVAPAGTSLAVTGESIVVVGFDGAIRSFTP